MFVSRADTLSRGGTGGQCVLIEVEEGRNADKCVIPAALEFVLRDTIERTTGLGSTRPNIVIAAVDRSPQDYEGLVRRCEIPPSNVIDGFSEWYSLELGSEFNLEEKEKKDRLVHIAMQNPCLTENGSLAGQILAALDTSVRRTATNRIVLIDSFSSVLRFWPGLHTFLDLRDTLYNSANGAGSECTLTLVGVIRRNREDGALIASLRRTVDTTVLLCQGKGSNSKKLLHGVHSGSDSRDLVTLKICRRKPSGRVQLDEVVTRIKRENKTLTQIESRNSDFNEAVSLSSKEEEERRQQKMLTELGLSFKVTLSTKEKEVRAAAGLPYLHQDESLADSALQLHPEALQISTDGAGDSADAESSDDDTDSDEDLFSEDV